jgi:hypothetical protein
MLNSIEDINNYPAVIILYPSGASGEFIAQALSESIYSIAKTHSHWENNNRVIYADFLGRSLNSGDRIIELDKVIGRANWFLETATPGLSIILAHPEQPTLDFIKKYIPQIPVIEIVLYQLNSKIFRKIAASNKIPRTVKHNPDVYDRDPPSSGYTSLAQLHIEWEDIILINPQEQFLKICKFLNVEGEVENFNQLIIDYQQRNYEIIKLLNNT